MRRLHHLGHAVVAFGLDGCERLNHGGGVSEDAWFGRRLCKVDECVGEGGGVFNGVVAALNADGAVLFMCQ